MSSSSVPPPSPTCGTPCARTNVKLSDDHPGRGVEFAEPLDPLGGEAGLLLQLLDRGALDRRIAVLVADQPGGQLEAAPPIGTRGWSTRIILPSMLGEDDDRAHVVGAADIFPSALLAARGHICPPT